MELVVVASVQIHAISDCRKCSRNRNAQIKLRIAMLFRMNYLILRTIPWKVCTKILLHV
jgi:hypothetical protein